MIARFLNHQQYHFVEPNWGVDLPSYVFVNIPYMDPMGNENEQNIYIQYTFFGSLSSMSVPFPVNLLHYVFFV